MTDQTTIDCGLFWCQAVGVYHSGGIGKREVRATANLTADATGGQPFHAFNHSLEIKAPSVSPDMIGKRFRVLLVEEPK